MVYLFDKEVIIEVVFKIGKVFLVIEDIKEGSIMSEVVVIIFEYCLFDLDVLIKWFVGFDILVMFYVLIMEKYFMVNFDKVEVVMRELVEF